ncbi:ATP-grasp peptide maturase system methyltransferase [Jiangella endophytica]|uniref:ATP-grasp peptide maturase system methyltransferase n=1 Tax=Jiangella endophytica TaxID=1623398 RepID=UPI001300BDF7|nr:ATP-grasp peptide maturase system methyltransferase [Jiangella endophytica]
MTTETGAGEVRAQQLRDQLADQLAASGGVTTPGWRQAVRRVPRHEFLPRFYAWQDTDGGPTAWVPVTRESVGEEAWLTRVYENTTWTTQLDGSDASWEREGPQFGSPTSSSTLPGLLVMMLEHLDVADGDKLLIVGTGTGYSTALASERLGSNRVVSVDVDPLLADRARARLHRVGYSATVIAGDGLAGHEPGAPYDRVIAFCSPTSIPSAWLAQARPGAVVVTTLTGALGGYGLVKLTVDEAGGATGQVLPQAASFMLARSQTNPSPIRLRDRMGPSHGAPRSARITPRLLDDNAFRFTAQLAVPDVMRFTVIDDGTTYTHFAHRHDGSWARLQQKGDGWLVEQGGARALWTELEAIHDSWTEAGSPQPAAYAISAGADGSQRIWAGGTELGFTGTSAARDVG